jgi:integrase
LRAVEDAQKALRIELLLAAGVHPKVVQERLGHSQIGVTMDTYSHVLPSMQREAAAKLDELLGKKH